MSKQPGRDLRAVSLMRASKPVQLKRTRWQLAVSFSETARIASRCKIAHHAQAVIARWLTGV
jgi:hypothetical protein